MGSEDREKAGQSYSDPYVDYDEDLNIDLDDATEDFNDLPVNSYNAVRETPSRTGVSLDTRREIERRNELKELHSQLDDWDMLEFENDW